MEEMAEIWNSGGNYGKISYDYDKKLLTDHIHNYTQKMSNVEYEKLKNKTIAVAKSNNYKLKFTTNKE